MLSQYSNSVLEDDVGVKIFFIHFRFMLYKKMVEVILFLLCWKLNVGPLVGQVLCH